MQTRFRNNSVFGAILAATLFVACRAEAQDTTWLARVTGEIIGAVGGETTRLKADNATFSSGFVGGKFLIEMTDTDVTIFVADSNGNPVRTIFAFDTVVRTAVNAKSERIFATGASMTVDGVPHAKLGSFSFTDAALFGTIQLDTNGSPASISASIEANGESDEGTFLFTGKVMGKTIFP